MLPRKWKWVAAGFGLAVCSWAAMAQEVQNPPAPTAPPAQTGQAMLQISVNWPRSTARTSRTGNYVVQGQPAQAGEPAPLPRGTTAPQAQAGAPIESASRPEQLST